MSKGTSRSGRSNKPARASSLKTFNPSGYELDGTKRIKGKRHTTSDAGKSLSAVQAHSLTYRKTPITLPKINLPPLTEEEEK